MLNVIMLSVVILSVYVILLGVTVLNVVVLSVIMLSVIVPKVEARLLLALTCLCQLLRGSEIGVLRCRHLALDSHI